MHKYFLNIMIFFVLLISCQKPELNINQSPAESNRTVLVIMEANNNLKYDAIRSINAMEKGFPKTNENLLVYIKTDDNISHLLKISHDDALNKINSDTIKTIQSVIPSNPDMIKEVIDYTKKNFPSESFGLILWSHATSWAPASQNIRTKSFGSDRGTEIDILDLKKVLPDNMDFIIFDACSMASVETLYELRNKCKYFISSPSETLAESYPYQEITPLLFDDLNDLQQIANLYYNHYNRYNGKLRSATVSLIDASQLNELASQTRLLILKNQNITLESKNIQRLDYTKDFPIPSYDFGDFLEKNFAKTEISSVKEVLLKTVLYKANTPEFMGIPILANSGITCYIPNIYDSFFASYENLEWYKDSGLNELYP